MKWKPFLMGLFAGAAAVYVMEHERGR